MPWFDWLRLFLALEVLWLHIPVAHRGNLHLVLPIAPVPAFVTISGYLIAQTLRANRDLPRFWMNRALRILPGFFLALLVTWLLFGDRALVDSLLSYVRMQPVITGPGSNFALWSLSVEEVLYLALALALMLGWIHREWFGRGMFWAAFCVVAVYAVVAMNSPRLGDELSHPHGGVPTGVSIPLFFFAGVYMSDSKYLPWVQNRAWWFLLTAVVGAASFYLVPESGVRGFLFVAMSVGGAFGVVGLGTRGDKVPRLPFDLSYGIYVLHLPVIHAVDRYSGLSGPPFVVACVALTMLSGAASWFLVERPFLSLKSRLGTPSSAKS